MASRRAAIVTPYGLFNYGNRLQNYAVQLTLEKYGYKPKTLIIRRPYLRQHFLDISLKVGHLAGLRGSQSAKYRAFLKFDRAIRKKRIWSDSGLRRVDSRYDVVVFGSDQIWNPHQIDLDGVEYGNFASTARKVAISPSFGVDSLPAAKADELASQLSDFYAISVREFAGQKIIGEATNRNVPVLIDPTMSVDVSEWRRVSSQRRNPQGKYIFVYLLGNYEANVREALSRYAEQKELKIVTLMDKAFPSHYASGPSDFLGLIDGATEVISDSFHAAIFSLMFRTEFNLLRRPGLVSMASRFSSLATHFNLKFHQNGEWPWQYMDGGDETDFNTNLARSRQEYFVFLDQALATE